MSINLISPSATNSSILIYDAGTYTNGPVDSVSSLTKVNGVPVNAALEIQSVTGTLLLPRMTTAQKNALTTVVDGMLLFDSDLEALQIRQTGAWYSPGTSGLQTNSFVISNAQVLSMFTTGIILVPAPGVGNAIIVNSVLFNYIFHTADFGAGGGLYLHYGTTGHGSVKASGTLANTFMTTLGANSMAGIGAVSGSAGVTSAITNKALCLTNDTALFNAGGGSLVVTVTYQVYAIS
jgi:hypothetical protein